MAYSELGIVNRALSRIGVEKITSTDWTTPATQQAIDADAIYDEVRDEVLESKDWVFAKKRVALGRLSEVPKSNFEYAYVLPSDFLRPARNTKQGTKEDIAVYPPGYPYKIEVMDIIAEEDVIPFFNPTVTYDVADETKIGAYCDLDFNEGKNLYICAEYKQEGASGIKIECESGTTDVLSVAVAGDVITITLANATTTKNTAALIQTAIRALLEVNDIDVSAWTVTENAAYILARPTTGIEISAHALKDGNKCYTAILEATGKFPAEESTYWTQITESPTKVLVTDYDDASGELVLLYIAKITDPTVYSALFVSALAWLLAAELSITRTEGPGKLSNCMQSYEMALMKADGLNSSMDYLDDETGNTDWEDAGR